MEKKSFYQSLEPPDQKQYRMKCKVICNVDPYLISKDEFLTSPDDWPPVTELDIVHYLVYSDNPPYIVWSQ